MSDSYLGNNDFWDDITCNQPYKLQISRNEYWICLKNKNPVQYTMMNIHQVVENSRHLENLVEEQKNKIQKLEEKISNIDEVIKQLVGGLFCQSTQEGILENYLRVLDGEGFSSKLLPEDTHNWNHWPTTRQGDDCEKRIADLERYMRDVTGDICRLKYPGQTSISSNFNYEEQDSYLLMRKHENSNMDCDNDCDSISTHSSMPDLVDDNSSTHSSMPDLEEIHSVDSDKRIRNSYDICGNN
jgi:tRNA U34 5-carboxymethylaminomethyl modifying enzyme MnmG/GidA